MQIDRSQFPLVFLRDTDVPAESTEVEFAALLAEGRRFVLIAKHHEHDHDDANDAPDAKKSRALFLKRNKEGLRALCAAAIVIEGAKATPMAFRLAARAFGKAFGVPFHFVHDEQEATALGNDVLALTLAGSEHHVADLNYRPGKDLH